MYQKRIHITRPTHITGAHSPNKDMVGKNTIMDNVVKHQQVPFVIPKKYVPEITIYSYVSWVLLRLTTVIPLLDNTQGTSVALQSDAINQLFFLCVLPISCQPCVYTDYFCYYLLANTPPPPIQHNLCVDV